MAQENALIIAVRHLKAAGEIMQKASAESRSAIGGQLRRRPKRHFLETDEEDRINREIHVHILKEMHTRLKLMEFVGRDADGVMDCAVRLEKIVSGEAVSEYENR